MNKGITLKDSWEPPKFNVFLVAGELPVYPYTSSDLEIVIIKMFQIIIETTFIGITFIGTTLIGKLVNLL